MENDIAYEKSMKFETFAMSVNFILFARKLWSGTSKFQEIKFNMAYLSNRCSEARVFKEKNYVSLMWYSLPINWAAAKHYHSVPSWSQQTSHSSLFWWCGKTVSQILVQKNIVLLVHQEWMMNFSSHKNLYVILDNWTQGDMLKAYK